jgi:predicted nucleotidyltransferase
VHAYLDGFCLASYLPNRTYTLVCSFSLPNTLATDHILTSSLTDQNLSYPSTMKYANKPSASSDKNVSDSSVPKKIKPISSVLAAKSTKKTPIKSSKKKPTVKYFHIFGSKCYILADREYRRKMDPKSDEGIFLGYSTNSRAFRVFNKKTQVVMESINVVIDDEIKETIPEVVSDVEAYPETSTPETTTPEPAVESDINPEVIVLEPGEASRGPSIRVQKNHPQDQIIGDPNQGIRTRRSNEVVSNSCFVSKFEPKNVKEALTDEFWIEAMQEELN